VKICEVVAKPELTERRGREEKYTDAYLALMETPVGKWRPFECDSVWEKECLAAAIRQRARKVGANVSTRSEGGKLWVKRLG